MVDRALVHPGVVNVMVHVDVHVIHCRVVEKMPVVPASAFITTTEVTEAIVDPTIETYKRAPVAVIEKKSPAAPAPIAWSPEEADFRSDHPRARHPVIAAISPTPIPRGPDIAVARANWLRVDGQLRRRDGDGDAYLRERNGRYGQHRQ